MSFKSISTLALACFAALSAAPGSAQELNRTFTVPEGCTGFLTVQSRACMVSHFWRCDADPEGETWRVVLDQDGPFYLSHTDTEFRWLQSWDLRARIHSVLVTPEEDPANLSELLSTGSDTMVFSVLEARNGTSVQRDYTGFDRLTGETVTIDGVELEVTEFAYQWSAEGMEAPRRTSGNQFVHRDWRLFFGGAEQTSLDTGQVVEYDNSPVEFVLPGEPGFLSLQPQYECGAMMSEAPTGLIHPDQIHRVSQ